MVKTEHMSVTFIAKQPPLTKQTHISLFCERKLFGTDGVNDQEVTACKDEVKKHQKNIDCTFCSWQDLISSVLLTELRKYPVLFEFAVCFTLRNCTDINTDKMQKPN